MAGAAAALGGHHALLHRFLLRMLMLAVVTSHALAFNSSGFNSSLILKDVVGEIARRERWDLEAVRISGFDGESLGVGQSRRHEFHVRLGRKTLLLFKFPEEVSGTTWRKPRKRGGERAWGWMDEPARWRRPKLKGFDLEGPLELKADGDDRLSLLLPMNTTHTGLKRILVGEGIKVKVEGAKGVTLSYPSSSGLPLCRSFLTTDYERNPFWLHRYSLCAALGSLHILGSASLVAYKTYNSKSYIETAFQFSDTVELLPEKCFSGSPGPDLLPSFLSLGSRVNILERILRSILGKQLSRLGTPHFLIAKIMPSTLVKFRLELERDINDNDRIWRKAPKWKTRPNVERDWFEVMAGEEAGRRLKLLLVRKLVKPLITVDSTAWSTLLSNFSFTQLQSGVAPPEALTLDVKW